MTTSEMERRKDLLRRIERALNAPDNLRLTLDRIVSEADRWFGLECAERVVERVG